MKNIKTIPNDTQTTLRFIALLRGVNVGGNRVIGKNDFQACFESMGFRDVKVVLQSGNIVFGAAEADPARLKTMIEAGLKERFGYPAQAIIIEADAMKKIIAKYPFDAGETDYQHYVVFLSGPPSKTLIVPENIDHTVEDAAPGKMVVYWKVQKGKTLDSTFGKIISRAKFKEIVTTRNLNTLKKLV